MPSADAAAEFITTLNGYIPYFTMKITVENKILFIDIDIAKNGTKLETQVYRKSTNTRLLLYFHCHTDKHYKVSLLKTMLHRAYALFSIVEAFNTECDKLRLINTNFIHSIQ